MVELTDREKKITLIKYIIHDTGAFSASPLEVREQMLEAATKILGLEYDAAEFLDIGEAILDVQQATNDSIQGFLKTNPELVQKALANLGKGGKGRFSLVVFVADRKRKRIGADGYISTGSGGILAHDPRVDKVHRLRKP